MAGLLRRSVQSILALPLALAACQEARVEDGRPETARAFPVADRPVSASTGGVAGTEVQRESVNEAEVVMDLAGIEPGMTVADIGAGKGYYTAKLAQRVGPRGRVLAEDIDRLALDELGLRIERERLGNVSIKLGTSDDPSLPPDSFDRIFMVHMYHEVTEPYAMLWRMRPALREGGRIIVVDVDRPTDSHGIPPSLLFCEFAAVGFRLREFVRKPDLQGYYAEFERLGARPEPVAITPCRSSMSTTGA